ncbi:MAG: hypothetical protein HWE13_09100 [Gammaproteobacteria bacterium]|nr:hypothetical protein [Gammaproteobacteria bacterium]NVK88272.1 hypothetical protein [Gammaproteobacteria bacterium]
MLKGLVSSILVASSSITSAVTVDDCVKITNDQKRLACYDAVFLPHAQATKVEDKVPAAKADAAERKTVAAPKPVTPVVPETPKVVTKSATPEPKDSDKVVSMTKEELFGLEDQVAELSVNKLESTLTGEFKYWKKGMTISLDNGQQWEITERRSLYHRVTNPKISIEKGSLGSFYLSIEGINSRLRIKRIK